LDENGNKQTLGDDIKQQLKGLIEKYAKMALRTFAFGYKDLQQNEGGENHDAKAEHGKAYEIEDSGLTLIALCGIKDIIREEVPGAVALCNEAGVRVRMVTGDNKITAVAIAKECGIINDGEELENELICMEGPEFNEYVGSLINKSTKERILVMGKEPGIEAIGNMENMKKVRLHTKVLARSRPNDKYIMVFGLKELGDIVAVTGDGTNDAPALKKANVGFAMKTGTQVAHTAADIIIQDDNFASIVKACKWGRNVYDNIRRFLQFQLTVNVVALITSFVAAVILKDPPLKPVQLLWVNMIMDSLASLALATELPVDELLHRPPYRKREYIISRRMVKHIGGQAIFQSCVLFVFIFAGPAFLKEEENMPEPFTNIRDGDYVVSGMLETIDLEPLYSKYKHITPSRHLSIIFNMFVWMQIFNMLCARKINDEINFLDGMHTNFMFIGVMIFIVGLQVFVMTAWSYETKIAQAFSVHLRGLTGEQWTISVLVGLVTFPINFALKFVPDEWCFIMGDEPKSDVEASAKEYEELLKIARKYKFREGSNSKVMGQYIDNKPGDSFKTGK
jgi:Ca2+ transporting ATPase